MPNASLLHDQIAAVCPIDGLTIDNWSDKTTWTIFFDPSATAAQKQAAASVVAAIDVTTLVLYTAQVWQLQAVMSASTWTGPTWTQVTTAVQNSGNATMIAFFTHPGNLIPSNSTTLAALGTQLGMTAAQITSLVQQASAISLP